MVLPAPTPDAAPAAHAWLDRLSLVLRLAGRSVIVLIDQARPERLGDLVRHLARERPETEVLLDAPSLATVADRSTVVLCVRAIDADWLNQERPVVQARSLRLVLFSDEATTLCLARKAVDFYDWISHRIDCPPGPPAFAARDLRRAACTRPAAIVWRGGDLEGTFAEALPGRALARVSAALPYPALVEALRSSAKKWLAITNLDSQMREHRITWAASEAGRRGRLVLVEPLNAPSALPCVAAQALTVEEGSARLSVAGIEGSARLAALLELSPTAIAEAATLALTGAGEAELSSLALREEDPAAALGHLARTRGVAPANDEEPAIGVPHSYRRGRFVLPDWPQRIDLAFRTGDLDVAAHWAATWKDTVASARSIAALARIRAFQGATSEAQRLLHEARSWADNTTDEVTRFELLRAEGMMYLAGGDTSKASRVVAEALGLAEHLERDREEQDDLRNLLIQCLTAAGRIKDAELTLNRWMAKPGVRGTSTWNPALVHAEAHLKLAQGDALTAAHLLENLAARWPAGEAYHPDRIAIEQSLVQAWLEQGRFREAEDITRASIHRLEHIGRSTTRLRHELGRALHGLGRFREAEHEFRHVMSETEPASVLFDHAALELARSLSAQGRLDEAEALLDGCLVALHQNELPTSPLLVAALLDKARIQILRGDLPRAELLLREVLRRNETSRGREDPALLQVLEDLSETLLRLDKPQEAEPLLRRALRISERVRNGPARARALAILAAAQAAQGFQHARSTARQSIEAWKATGDEVSPTHLRDLEDIAAGVGFPRSAPSRRRR